MTPQEEFIAMRDALSSTQGTLEALHAAVIGIIVAMKHNPEIGNEIKTSLEFAYSSSLASSINQPLVNSFELSRDYLVSMIDS